MGTVVCKFSPGWRLRGTSTAPFSFNLQHSTCEKLAFNFADPFYRPGRIKMFFPVHFRNTHKKATEVKSPFPKKAFVYTGLISQEKEWLWIHRLKCIILRLLKN